MRMKKRQKRPVTLIEIMIVILLIGIIGGALAFNMRGSLDKGREFKTDQNIKRVQDILEMAFADSPTNEPRTAILKKWEDIVAKSPLANGSKTTLDGRNKKLVVNIVNDEFVASVDPK